jgi:dipeptidyl aminopeptidase/acylaminoacyl peptidase
MATQSTSISGTIGEGRPTARKWLRRTGLAAMVALPVVVLGALSVLLADQAVHIPARRLFEAHREIADGIATQTNATWRDVSINSFDGARLKGWEFRPKEWNGAEVLFLHGHLDTREGPARGFASMFLKRGYAVLMPDGRGHGVSGGVEATYGIREREDIRRWVSLAVNGGAQKMYALGESMGAAILLQALPDEPRIRAAVAEGSYTDFRRVAYQRVARQTGLGRELPGLFVEPAFVYLRLRYGLPLDEASPEAAVVRTKTPVLYIHGTGDTNISPDQSATLYALRRAGNELWQPPGATHTRAAAFYPEEFERRVFGWFAGH